MDGIALDIWSTLQREFSDIADASEATRVVVRLGMAVLLGGIIGFERERRGKPAGLRTHMLVSLGAALFVLVPLQAGMALGDASRVLQGIIAGIGFLGAGAIIKYNGEGNIKGLTTAATIWLAAAIGVAAGMGRELTALFTTVLAWLILSNLHRLEKRIEHGRRGRRARRRAGWRAASALASEPSAVPASPTSPGPARPVSPPRQDDD